MLLTKNDPHPVEYLPAETKSGLLVCEHAGSAVPERLDALGLPDTVLQQHIAYDIGAAATARLIAKKLCTPLEE